MTRNPMVIEPGLPSASGILDWIRTNPLKAYFTLAFTGSWVVFSPIILAKVLGLFALPDSAAVLLFHSASNTSLMLIGKLALEPLTDEWVGLEIFGVAALVVIVLTRGRLAYDPEGISGFST